MRRFLRSLAWILALSLGGLTASAHEDVVLELKEGKLVVSAEDAADMKVPAEYLPMEYDAATHRVRIGKHVMKMIPYFTSLFPENGKYKIHFSASWYHDLDTLPPYLLIRIEPEGRQYNYHLLLNMKDLSVIQMEVALELGDGGTRYLPVDLSMVEKEMKESIKPVEEK
ncbi:hypothetical protein [Luteolibacter soli]|uniref:Uncharacterized protein n=1 Tax=Luteolibacter soli TaxID=3135280 RepID=A0ABU9AVD0_9BACT